MQNPRTSLGSAWKKLEEEAHGNKTEVGMRMGVEVLKSHFQINNILDLLQEKKFGGLVREEDDEDL